MPTPWDAFTTSPTVSTLAPSDSISNVGAAESAPAKSDARKVSTLPTPSSPPVDRRPRPPPTRTIAAILSVSNSISREALEELDAAFTALPINQHPTRGNLINRLLHVRGHQHGNPITRLLRVRQHQQVDPATTAVYLFDNFAYHVAPHEHQPWRLQPWETQIVAIYREVCAAPGCAEGAVWCPSHTEREEQVNVLLTALFGIIKVVNSEPCRLQPWLSRRAVERTTQVSISVEKRLGLKGKLEKQEFKDVLQLMPGDAAGVSMTVVRLLEDEYCDSEEVLTSPTIDMRMGLTARTRVCSGGGFGVISTLEGTLWDIDPSDPVSVLRAVFSVRNNWYSNTRTETVTKLLRYMVRKLDNPPFWYISLAPYCLYPLLQGLRDRRYPFGVLLMRNVWWGLASNLLMSFMVDAKGYKLEYLRKIHETWPKRKMVLVGSANLCDAMVFAEMYVQQPTWIGAIILRRYLLQSSSSFHCNDQQLQYILNKVPRALWCVVSDTECEEAYVLVDLMKRTQG